MGWSIELGSFIRVGVGSAGKEEIGARKVCKNRIAFKTSWVSIASHCSK